MGLLWIDCWGYRERIWATFCQPGTGTFRV
jgi:hypothetical protein